MNPRPHRFTVLLAAGAAAAIGAAGLINRALFETRSAQRTHEAVAMEDAPPLVAFTTLVLGGFRGIVADLLWLRAARMQEDGRFFELVQLSDWITRLEPRTPETWAYHAWNMAYNVSAMMSDPDERWRWVRNGIDLLRGNGLRYNPDEPSLYFELGWLFQHKIGRNLDPFHLRYKEAWFREMDALFGGARPDVDRLRRDPESMRAMKERYRLDPALIGEVDERYGPLDWRTPEAHAVYWAELGLRVAGPEGYFRCERMLYQALATSFLRGSWRVEEPGGALRMEPNPAILDKVLAVYDDAVAKYPMESVRISYFNFLGQAVALLRRAGGEEEARRVFERLRERFPTPDTLAGYDAFVRKWIDPLE